MVTLKAAGGESIPLYGDGLNVRDWLYVEDHAKAIDIIFHRGNPGETYNVGGDCEKTNIDLIRIICNEIDFILNNLNLVN